MSAKFDTGHAKNVSNFEDLISFCIGQGASYNPSKEALTVAKLKELHTQAKDMLAQVNSSKASFDRAINARRIAFSDLQPFSTKVINALIASGASDLTIEDARGINRKIQGARSHRSSNNKNESDSSESTGKTISTSQHSFDNLMEHFSKMIEILSLDGNYNPNEAALKVAALKSRLDHMESVNSDLINASTSLSNAILLRNNTLYNSSNGLVQTALAVKNYVKSVYGAKSPEYKQISRIEFRKFKAA
jgi:hypothetical protein